MLYDCNVTQMYILLYTLYGGFSSPALFLRERFLKPPLFTPLELSKPHRMWAWQFSRTKFC